MQLKFREWLWFSFCCHLRTFLKYRRYVVFCLNNSQCNWRGSGVEHPDNFSLIGGDFEAAPLYPQPWFWFGWLVFTEFTSYLVLCKMQRSMVSLALLSDWVNSFYDIRMYIWRFCLQFIWMWRYFIVLLFCCCAILTINALVYWRHLK